ncbi:MAG: hypothetical protein ABSD31_11085 [Candidatus Binataceae bacterium]
MSMPWRYHQHLRPQRLIPILALAIIALGCASRKEPQTASVAQAATAAATPTPQSSLSALGSIQISYSHPNDYLDSLSVTKFTAARVILSREKNGKTFSVVRFQGGHPVWAIHNEGAGADSILGPIPGVGKARSGAVKSVSYGHAPRDFVQDAPDYGSPEPLEPNRFYVFAVTRGSGARSFQAVKVQPDGSIEAFDADPHAGTSYELCCDLPTDFTSAPSETEEAPDSASDEPSSEPPPP